MLVCPVCKNILIKNIKDIKNIKIYKCEKNHSFDIHKNGYVNLLMSHKKNSKLPGDNKIMVEARRNFLKNGYYDELLSELIKIVDSLRPETVLDAGCGEGYYTNRIFREGRKIYGFDISKTAVNFASRENKKISYFVASVFDIPVKSNSIDLLINIFAPYSFEEFKRVLNGYMILVIPGENHLMELKSIVYDNPYENMVGDYELDGFEFINATKINSIINIKNKDDINNLFKMTPYYYKTKKEDYQKILEIENLETTISFEIILYKAASRI